MPSFGPTSLLSIVLSTALYAVALADNPAPPAGDTSTPAPTTAPAGGTSSDQSAADQEIVCKQQDAPTGSRMGARKVCHTVKEWRDQAAAAHALTNDMERQRQPPQGGN